MKPSLDLAHPASNRRRKTLQCHTTSRSCRISFNEDHSSSSLYTMKISSLTKRLLSFGPRYLTSPSQQTARYDTPQTSIHHNTPPPTTARPLPKGGEDCHKHRSLTQPPQHNNHSTTLTSPSSLLPSPHPSADASPNTNLDRPRLPPHTAILLPHAAASQPSRTRLLSTRCRGFAVPKYRRSCGWGCASSARGGGGLWDGFLTCGCVLKTWGYLGL